MIGFKQSRVLAMEGTSAVDDLQVKFWSGSGDSLLDNFDVLVTIHLSNESTAILGKKSGEETVLNAYQCHTSFCSNYMHKDLLVLKVLPCSYIH